MLCAACGSRIPNGSTFCNRCGVKQTDTPPTPQPEPPQKPKRTRGNHTGYVAKRGKTWTAYAPKTSFISDGVVKRKSPASKGGFKTKAEAYAAIPSLMGVKKKRRTLEHYWQLWSTDDMLKLSESKQYSYKTAYKRLSSILLRDITTLDIEDLRQCVASESVSFYTAKDMKSLLSHLYKMACAEQVVSTMLPAFIQLPSHEEKEPEPFSADELSKIWTAYEAGQHFAGFILIMIYTGMMPGELLSLRKDNIAYDTNEIIGAGIKTNERKKKSMVFPDFVKPVLLAMCEASPTDKLVNMNSHNFYTAYHEFTAKTGIRDLPPYSCRHTTATALALMDGIAPTIIQRIMRHTKFSTTEHYIHTNSQPAVDAINRLPKQQN